MLIGLWLVDALTLLYTWPHSIVNVGWRTWIRFAPFTMGRDLTCTKNVVNMDDWCMRSNWRYWLLIVDFSPNIRSPKFAFFLLDLEHKKCATSQNFLPLIIDDPIARIKKLLAKANHISFKPLVDSYRD